nr:hypothetical protein [uncultured Roseateles sp.]
MTPSDQIAVAALVVAGCAFFATAWQAFLAHRHNRLSVRPYLVWHRDQSTTEAGTEVTFKVSNCGIGPAIVKERFFSINDKRFQPGQTSGDEVRELAVAVLAQRFQYHLSQHSIPGIHTAIPQGGEYVIARILFPNANDGMVNSILKQSGKIDFCIRFESLYGEDFVFSTDKASRQHET